MTPVSVCHIVSGDLWAGVESQLAALLKALHDDTRCALQTIVLNPGPLAEHLTHAGIPTHIVDESKANLFLGRHSIYHRVCAIVRENRFDILHSHRYKENLLAALCSRVHRPALAQTIHGNAERFQGFAKLKMNAYLTLNQCISRRTFDAIICVSNDIRRVAEATLPAQKLHVIRNAISPDTVRSTRSRSDVRASLALRDDDFVVSFAGRLAPVKNIPCLLRATAHAAKSIPQLQVIIAGEGQQRNELEVLTSTLQITDRVHFLGFRSDIYDIIAASDAFTLCSHNEGIPMVVLEAMQLGTPCVLTNVGGIPEIVSDNTTGILVASDSHTELADSWTRLATSDSKGKAIVENARRCVAQTFYVSTQVEQLLELYSSLRRR